jgi:hypothetical protein
MHNVIKFKAKHPEGILRQKIHKIGEPSSSNEKKSKESKKSGNLAQNKRNPSPLTASLGTSVLLSVKRPSSQKAA